MAVLISDPFVQWGGIFGGALAYVILTATLMAMFALIALTGVVKNGRSRK